MLIIAIMLINNRPNCRDNADEFLHELTGSEMAAGTQHLIHWENSFRGNSHFFAGLINDINRGNINLVKTKNTRVDVYFRVLHKPWRRPLIIVPPAPIANKTHNSFCQC